MLHFWSIVSDLAWWSIIVGIPLCAFGIRPGNGATHLGLRFQVGVFGTWITVLLHRWFIGLPIARAQAAARGDWKYDGIGLNASLLLFGWIPGLVVSAAAWLAIRYWCNRNDTRPRD